MSYRLTQPQPASGNNRNSHTYIPAEASFIGYRIATSKYSLNFTIEQENPGYGCPIAMKEFAPGQGLGATILWSSK
jgi:hypothetical protein